MSSFREAAAAVRGSVAVLPRPGGSLALAVYGRLAVVVTSDPDYGPHLMVVRQTWSGMTRPGQEIVFTSVLLPHTPAHQPRLLLEPAAGWNDPKRIEVAVDRDDLLVVKVVSETDPQHKFRQKNWVMLNTSGSPAKGGPIASDGLVAAVGHDWKGRIANCVVVGGKALAYEGADQSAKARKHTPKGLAVPKELLR